jgi:hypothetical protein
MLVWPSVVLLGFLAIIVLVVVLGASSTARYEFDRNRVRDQRAATADTPHAAAAGAGGAPAGAPRMPVPTDGPQQPTAGQRQVAVAAHPAGKRSPADGVAVGWWLVTEQEDQAGPGVDVVAGPFPDRTEADWAVLSGGLHAVAVYGAWGAGTGLVPQAEPQERAWLAELGEQLDRLPGDWDDLLTDDDPMTTLVVEVAAALVEAGMTLHDCDGHGTGGGAAGGVCLIPDVASGGILVSWRQHDRMSLQQVRGGYLDAAVQQTMNATLADVLRQLGFVVELFGSTGCSLVTALRR